MVGVTVLLAVLVLRQADFGIKTSHGLLSIMGIYAILIAGPRLSNMVPPVVAFLINIVCIMLLMIMGCHNVIMYNHSARNRWYIKLTFIVSSAMFVMNLLNIPRAMWIGIACMSVCLPFSKDIEGRAGKRGAFNVIGCLIFSILYTVLPQSMYPYIGMIGGIGVGYSAGYSWQTVFNTFGALSIAAELFGLKYAVLLRIGVNVVGAAYTLLCDRLIDKIYNWCTSRKVETA